MKICMIEGCDKKVYGRGLCSKHYWRLMRNGSPFEKKYEKRGEKCKVEGCENPVYSKGFCNFHWQRYRKYGSAADSCLKNPDVLLDPVTRFHSRYKIDKKTGCWNWIARKDNDGYGVMWYEGYQWRANRLSYYLNVGEIPKGKYICHHCDNPSCVNPDHLYPGTAKQNVQDKMERGRSNCKTGEKSHSAKLTEKQAIEIIKAAKRGEKHDDLAVKYNVSHWTIGEIWRGKSWKSLDYVRQGKKLNRRKKHSPINQ